jgi:hypothetical protein
MAHRSIEETFRAIRPRGQTGVPDAPTIAVGVAGSNGDLSTSLSQAGQQISQLQAAYQQQAALVSANTLALQSNTSAQGGHTLGDTAGKLATGLFGGALGLLSPLISGIAGLFSSHSTPAPLPIYTPPAPVAISSTLQSGPQGGSQGATGSTASGTAASAAPPTAAVQNVTVNVSAMDSQSFLDRSADIANAVREAMLNLHPINDVVANL